MQNLLDIEPVRKQSDHRLLFGSSWAACGSGLMSLRIWEHGNAEQWGNSDDGWCRCRCMVLVDVCVHNGINVGELVGAERPTEYTLRFLKYIVHTLVFFKFFFN